MDIGRTEGVGGMGRIEGASIERVSKPSLSPTPAPADKVEISDVGRLVSEAISMTPVRMDRIAELKHLIETGAYQTDARLAGAFEAFVRENPDIA